MRTPKAIAEAVAAEIADRILASFGKRERAQIVEMIERGINERALQIAAGLDAQAADFIALRDNRRDGPMGEYIYTPETRRRLEAQASISSGAAKRIREGEL